MIFIKYDLETSTRGRVNLFNYRPDTLSQELIDTGLLVETVPEAVQKEGRGVAFYINPETSEMWYEYTDRPPSIEERIAEVERGVGAGGKISESGFAKRIDDLEARIKALESV